MSNLTIPETGEADKRGWAQYVEPIRITSELASSLHPGAAAPEAVVAGFYAALIRGDDQLAPFFLDPDSEVIRRKLDRLRSWTFHTVEIRARRLRGATRATLRLALMVEIDGKRSSGQDEIKVRRDSGSGGLWRIERPPT